MSMFNISTVALLKPVSECTIIDLPLQVSVLDFVLRIEFS